MQARIGFYSIVVAVFLLQPTQGQLTMSFLIIVIAWGLARVSNGMSPCPGFKTQKERAA